MKEWGFVCPSSNAIDPPTEHEGMAAVDEYLPEYGDVNNGFHHHLECLESALAKID
jgi:hypothetical protein